MQANVSEIAKRIVNIRESLDLSAEEMAAVTGVTLEKYKSFESGTAEFSFTFLYKCAERFGIDMMELLTGASPLQTGYTVVRSGKGLQTKRHYSLKYVSLAPTFQSKISEPYLVTAPYNPEEQHSQMVLATHDGQEFNYVLYGSLKFMHDGHIEILNKGDSVYFDSTKSHGFMAVGGKEAMFLSVIMKDK